ncbi:hypothetical protein H0H87_007131 [Tephrocybe sp. NHM501043]|nr:hypothetical protein H0H87_007131 [Tephrocybe sp. NHM501043]
MLGIPLDFVQSCTLLLDLRLSNMSLKSFPKSPRHALPLWRLDLDKIRRLPRLAQLVVVGNQIASLPDEFRNLGALRKMDVRRNCITALGGAVTMLGNLEQLLVDHNSVQAQSRTWAPGPPLRADVVGRLARKALKPRRPHSITYLRLETAMHLTQLDPHHTQLPRRPQPIGIPHLLRQQAWLAPGEHREAAEFEPA